MQDDPKTSYSLKSPLTIESSLQNKNICNVFTILKIKKRQIFLSTLKKVYKSKTFLIILSGIKIFLLLFFSHFLVIHCV